MNDLALRSAPTITRDRFRAVLIAANSPAAPLADALYALILRYGLNPAVALAFFKHESSCGTAGVARATKNWGNLRRSRGHASSVHDGWAWYLNWADGLEDWCLLVHEYEAKGLDTITKMIPVYAPSSDGNAPARYIQFVLTAVASWQEAPVPQPDDTFHYTPLHWHTVAAFIDHLSHYSPDIAPWLMGVTVHHTLVPVPSQWRGLQTLEGIDGEGGLLKFYKAKGWDGGPHLFICVGAPNPADDGIWQFTPLNMPGIHAGVCNRDHASIEVVGNYDAKPWPAMVADMVYGAAGAILNWRRLGPAINGHRECLPNKTCPGSAINLDAVRVEMSRRMEASAPTQAGTAVTRWRCIARPSLRVRAAPNTQAKAISTIQPDAIVSGVLVDGESPATGVTNKWLKIADGRYAWAGLLEQVK